MTSEQAYFLQLLRDYVHQCPSARPGTIDWQQISRYAKEQSLGGIAYVQCRDFLPCDSEVLSQLHRGFHSAVYTYVNGNVAFDQIADQFQKSNISYMPFKGGVLCRYYPNPELRTMGDRDILIRPLDRESTDRIIRSLGYKRYADGDAVWTYTRPNIMFEIHNSMIYEYLSNQINYKEYFNQIWDTAIPVSVGGDYVPEPNMHFLYLVCHTAKHIINNGIGFRAFLDMVFMSQNEENLKWDWITAELERLKLLDFTKTCFALCERWFDLTMPLSHEELDEDFFEKITAKTFNDGTFGLQNEQNESSYLAKTIEHSKQSYWITTMILTWKEVFPLYRDMRSIPWYKFVDGRPWLMPFAWVYRWFYIVPHKFKDGMERLMKPFVKKKVIEKRRKYINDWGL